VSRQKLRIKETVQITPGDLFFIGLQIAVASVFLAAPSYYSNAGIYVFGIGCAAYTSLVISLVFRNRNCGLDAIDRGIIVFGFFPVLIFAAVLAEQIWTWRLG